MPKAAKWATARRRKPTAVSGFLVVEDFNVDEPGRVVDADVDVLPADPAAGAPVAVDAVARPADPAELLDVDVHELARPLLLVAVSRFERLQPPELAEPDPGQDPRHRRDRHPKRLGDLGACHPQSTQRSDRRDTRLACPQRHRRGRRTTIEQTLLALTGNAAATSRPCARSRRRPRPPPRASTPALNPIDRQATAVRTGPRVSVQLHPDHPPWSWWLGSSSLQGGPDGTTLSGTTARPYPRPARSKVVGVRDRLARGTPRSGGTGGGQPRSAPGESAQTALQSLRHF